MILTGLTKYRDLGLLLLRVGIGCAFIAHGWPKLMGGSKAWAQTGAAMGYLGINFAPAAWGFLAALAEAAGGALLVLGFLFRPACIILVLDMTVAIIFHLNQTGLLGQFGPGWSHPMEDGILFLALTLIGPGKYSIDRQ
ncbi:MAG TPA: DoxX family protein [Tepidisphaeraceae bacterium]|jgi:putative oxidoreductase